MGGTPERIAALLYEGDDNFTKSARYVRTWPPEETTSKDSTKQSTEQSTELERERDFFTRLGDGSAELGKKMVTEDGKVYPKEFIFFEPEEKNVHLFPKFAPHSLEFHERILLESDGILSLSNAFAYLLRRAKVMRYHSCLSMLTGLRNYYVHVILSQGRGGSQMSDLTSPNSTLDLSLAEEDDLAAWGAKTDEIAEGGSPPLHMQLQEVVQACTVLEAWLISQESFESDYSMAEKLKRSLHQKLVKLLDEQLELVQRELLLRACDIFAFPSWYQDLSEEHLNNAVYGDAAEAIFAGQNKEDVYVRDLSIEDDSRVCLYRRIVSQAIDAYFYDDWNARMELWAFQRSPVRWRDELLRGSQQGRRACMKFIASKPMGDLTDTRVPSIVYIATNETGVKLIAIRRSMFY